MPARRKVDAELKLAMEASLKAYSKGDARFFDYLSDGVRIFNLNSTEPMVGRKKFESAFAANFKTKRTVTVVSQDIQPSGDQAILMQTLRITTNGIANLLRQTVVWERGEDKAWKMSHIHNALVGHPVVADGSMPLRSRDVLVLNERIATVAATLGVAQ